MNQFRSSVLIACALVAGLVGCDRERAASPAVSPEVAGEMAAPTASTEPVVLEDVSETTPDYIVGISFPPAAARYPGLARQMRQYADGARAELMQAVESRRQDPTGPESAASMYDLSLAFTEVLQSPEVVAYAAEGSTYTGGAHGMPLVARFVWLPGQERLLTADDLVSGEAGWQPISDYVREQLHTSLSQRLDADELTPEERREMVSGAVRMIEDGTRPEPENFALFEPIAGPGDKLAGLRFVFPPYQVGPYSDGVQQVDVPASVLLPQVAAEYRSLFVGATVDGRTAGG